MRSSSFWTVSEFERLPVAGGSAGALAAVQFALRHPNRCSGLVLLVPAANVRGRDPVEMGPVQKFFFEQLLRSDLMFWTALKTIPDRLVGTLLATDPILLGEVFPAERSGAYKILKELMPIGARWRGVLNDARLAGNPARVDFRRIRAPTLVLSVEDDRFGTAATARHIAVSVPRARLVMLSERRPHLAWPRRCGVRSRLPNTSRSLPRPDASPFRLTVTGGNRPSQAWADASENVLLSRGSTAFGRMTA